MPTTFIDGPMGGTGLDLRRAPNYLRVTRDVAGKVDALDQLDDTPRDDEHLEVYALTAPASMVFVCIRGKGRGGSGGYANGHYRHVPLDQQLLETFRDNEAWREWASAQPDPPFELATT